jgi:hypothetical protein
VTALASLHPGARRDQWRWRAPQVEQYSGAIRAALLADLEAHDAADYVAGNQRLAETHRKLQAAHFSLAFDEQAVRDHAENYARLCARMSSLAQRATFAEWLGVESPAGKSITPEGAAARLDDPLWWRRQLRKVWTRAAENAQRDLGLIRRGRAPYASDEAVRQRAAQKRRMRAYLENHVAVNEEGEQLLLLDAAEKSLANPALRRGEFMCRVRGFEEIARDLGHVAEFVTLTTPSRFHAQLAGGGRNPAFERAIVRDAQAWLCQQWARARAKLKRLSVLFYGFRIAEPHHDATPHWHLLLFVAPRNLDTLRGVLKAAWLRESGDEAGARDHRVKFESVDPAKGSAVGYIAKYVSKNIDGKGAIGDDSDRETGNTVTSGLERVAAWAALHGVRQFQQIGGPPVGLWREARRLHDRVPDPDMERARERADAGDWRGFTRSVGGIHAGRRTNLRLERCERGDLNRYAEPRPAAIIGLRYASAVAITRPHQWRIERQSCASISVRATAWKQAGHARAGSVSLFDSFHLGPVAITVRGAAESGAPSAWSNPNETSQAGPKE